MRKFEPISNNFAHLLIGGDYNPEQWLDYPQILSDDMALMKEANCNEMTMGILNRLSKKGIMLIIAVKAMNRIRKALSFIFLHHSFCRRQRYIGIHETVEANCVMCYPARSG